MELLDTFEEIKKRNTLAFRRLFDEVYQDLVRFAEGYLYDLDTSEDLVQKVLAHIWENAVSLEIKSSLKGYLYAMVRNRCLNHLKSLKITDHCHILDINTVLISDCHLEPFADEDKNVIYAQVLDVVDSLPHKMQLVFKMKFLENCKYAEIAEELSVSVNTVKTQLRRAKRKIAQTLITLLMLLSTYYRP